jgi:hypothetical protein
MAGRTIKTTDKAKEVNLEVATSIESETSKDDLEGKLLEMQKQIEMLTQLMASTTKTSVEEKEPIKTEITKSSLDNNLMDVSSDEGLYDDPHPNKNIRVKSMCFGKLCLSEEPGKPARYKFQGYGDVIPIQYSNLVNVVTNHRKFAKAGYFYIMDKAAVHCLGLAEDYKNIVSFNIIDNITSLSDSEIREIVNTMISEQRNVLASLICDKAYKNPTQIDLNKVETLGKAMGLDLVGKIKDMGNFSNLSK